MTTYYVATSGSDSGNGSASSPFKSINKALRSNLKAGDEIVVKAGTYNEQVIIDKNGSAAGYITVRSEVPGGAKIVAPAEKSGIIVVADYVKVDGFDVSGATTGGITTSRVHHVQITNNTVHDGMGNGISVNQSEFILVEGNTTYRNANDGARSGISIFHAENVSGDTTTEGYRIVVRGNISYDNVTKTGAHTDGNGIIIDSFKSPKATYGSYAFETLVENNLVYSNGGAGVLVFYSDKVTVLNNTSWHNGRDPLAITTWKGELSNIYSSHVTYANNIAVADSTIKSATALENISGKQANVDVVYANNLTWNGTAGNASLNISSGNTKPNAADGNLLGVDPGFVGAPKSFLIKAGAAGVDAGTKAYGVVEHDLLGNLRDSKVDIGAYEAQKPISLDKLIHGTEGAEKILGLEGNDRLYGHGGNDSLSGGAGNDWHDAGAGNDTVQGGLGDDTIIGGVGQDRLLGYKGADTFVFLAASDSTVAAPDYIADCWRTDGDRIDLSAIDANSRVAGNQAFSFITDKAFSGTAGQLRFKDGEISGDINGDKVADLMIKTDGHWLGSADFIL